MQPASEIRGKAASEGIFTGPVVVLGDTSLAPRLAGNPDAEKAELARAVKTAIRSIRTLTVNNGGEAGDILEFQIAMLEDPRLQDQAVADMARGVSAPVAWWNALENEISGYANSPEEAFSARAADLRDIRDRVLRVLSGEAMAILKQGSVLVGDDLPPSLFLETDWSKGGAIALRKGSVSSHVAMLARSRGVPMVTGLGQDLPENCTLAIVDGTEGLVFAAPPADLIAAYEARKAAETENRDADDAFLMRAAKLRDGSPVEVQVNIASLEELQQIDPRSCDGIGLVRSEFLFGDGAALPGEDEQFSAYRKILRWAKGKPVTIRTLDAGGDKPLRGFMTGESSNRFLGLRGIRLTLSRPDVFRVQLRALARAAIDGNLKVMLPMVGLPSEFEQAAVLLDQCVGELQREGTACARPPLGIMIEVPAAAICPELFATAAFFSIGTNDLIQFVTASSREDVSNSHPVDVVHPAIFRLIGNVVNFGRESHIPVSVCGDLASKAQQLTHLVDAGITSLSVAPAALSRVKAALSRI